MNSTTSTWAGPVLRVNIPATRDPLINTPLISLGKNSEGIERFWISSWNSNSGTLGVLVDENGNERIYRFPLPHAGFYSAALEDEDTLWLCGDLSRVVRLTLSSGEFESFETGAPATLVFQGMILDKAQGKLFALAFPPPLTTAFSFDYRQRRSSRVYSDVYEASGIAPEEQAHYSRYHFLNSDGSYSFITLTPGVTVFRWNPQTDELTARRLCDLAPETWEANRGVLEKYYYGPVRLIHNEKGETYFPYLGWCDGQGDIVASEPRPQREMKWFARHEDFAWGMMVKDAQTTVGRWDMKSGEVTDLCTMNDTQGFGVTMSQQRRIVMVNVYGEFRRYDSETGALEVSRQLPTNAVGHVDCLCRVDEDRLLGTPFISQRFWLANLKTGEGFDAGRAASGSGEVLQTWKINGKVYMASYTQGQLTEFDPAGRGAFPENPRLVAQPPGGMRPVAATQCGDVLYYSCSYHYGHLGGVLTKFNTVTGEASYKDDPFPAQCIKSLHYHAADHSLIGGSTIYADCRSCPPTADRSAFVRLDAETLEVRQTQFSEGESVLSEVYGQLDEQTYLARLHDGKGGMEWLRLDAQTLESQPFEHPALQTPDLHSIKYAQRSGLYIWHMQGQFELWDMSRMERLAILHDDAGIYRYHVQDASLYLVTHDQVIVLEGCLPG